MTDLDISAYQLAKRIHVSSNTLNMFLDPNVSATPGAATTLALANFLDASIDDMIGRRPPSRTQETKARYYRNQTIPRFLSKTLRSFLILNILLNLPLLKIKTLRKLPLSST
ncbi:hypothetical protein [Rickettsia felis]|uniref:hypothetical protein n=1 Tax=Rickettsia felis TaxID=42862 RepID=UPI0005749177|nr:hypothetical protein [Rickettsia felis]KHO02196.1 hypothetical protein JS55_08060 [Rickettsia felis str. LSU]